MQPGCGGGCAATGIRASINGLVALTVFGAVLQRGRPSDVGRQRNVSQLFHQGKKVGYWIKTQGALTEVATGDDLRGQLRMGWGSCRTSRARCFLRIRAPKIDLFSHTDLSSRTHQRLPLQRPKLA